MQVTLTPDSPAEKRLVAAFMNDLADLQELQREQLHEALNACRSQVVAIGGTEEAAEQQTQPEKPKRTSRAKKEEPSATGAETPVESGSSSAPAETAQGEAGNASAPTVTEEAPGSAAETTSSPATPAHSHDDLRKLFAGLNQAGKGDAAIAALGKLGHTNIKGIPAEKLDEAYDVMAAL